MKRFQFRLEKVLSLRHQETDQAQRALGAAMAQEDLARRATDNAHAVLNARLVEIRHRERTGLTAFDFGLLRDHIQVLQQELQAAEDALELVRQLTERKRQELVAARQRERSLERLRERRLQGYTSDSVREEQKELDEFGDRQGLNIPNARSDI